MKTSARFVVLLLLVGVMLLAGLVTVAGRASASIDLTGTWTVTLYGDLGGTGGLPCVASFVQSGSNLSGKVDCAPPIGEPPPLSLSVVGSFDKGSRTFSTTILQRGSFTGSVSETGNCMSGQWMLLPGTPYALQGHLHRHAGGLLLHANACANPDTDCPSVGGRYLS